MRLAVILLVFVFIGGCQRQSIEDLSAAGDREAMIELAGNYLFGVNGYEKNWQRGEELLARLTLRGDSRAAHHLGVISFIRGDEEEAIARFERAARMGDIASSLMAASLLQIRGCSGGSAEKVLGHLESAVAKGDPEGQRQLNRLIVGLKEARNNGALDQRSIGCYVEADRRGYFAEVTEV